ncbi:MAG: hypothetical protein JWR09_1402 [Mucilaginibacter sp.]|nr:hypothetical protein [Mucilaginibacter sp.]
MSKILFYVFISIFSATALITLLGIIGWLNIKEGYLNKLFYSLIVEVIGGIIALFKSEILNKPKKVKLRFDIDDEYDIYSVSTFGYTAKLINQDDNNKETILKGKLYHDNEGLCSDVEIINYKQTLSVTIDINGKKYRGSEWLDARRIKLN